MRCPRATNARARACCVQDTATCPWRAGHACLLISFAPRATSLCWQESMHARNELTRELAIWLEQGLPFIMVHERDVNAGGCDFSRFFGEIAPGLPVTPPELFMHGIYNSIATSYYAGPYRPVSVALIARAIATEAGATNREERPSLFRRTTHGSGKMGGNMAIGARAGGAMRRGSAAVITIARRASSMPPKTKEGYAAAAPQVVSLTSVDAQAQAVSAVSVQVDVDDGAGIVPAAAPVAQVAAVRKESETF